MTTVSLPLLTNARIASPCRYPWDAMRGEGATRDCPGCGLRVHNLSAMSAEEGEAFLRSVSASVKAGKRVCIAYYRRADGTILTADCPVGLARLKRRVWGAMGRAIAAVIMLGFGGAVWSASKREAFSHRLRSTQPFRAVCDWVSPPGPPGPPPPTAAQLAHTALTERRMNYGYYYDQSWASPSRSGPGPYRSDGSPYTAPSSPERSSTP